MIHTAHHPPRPSRPRAQLLPALTALLLALPALAMPTSARAECYVAYKARQTDPLRLHYGMLSLSGACPAPEDAEAETAQRIAGDGWQLLTIVTRSNSAPTDQQKADAGEYYLRY